MSKRLESGRGASVWLKRGRGLTMNVRDQIPASQRQDALAKPIELGQAAVLKPHSTQRITRQGAAVQVSIISTALINEVGRIYAIATTERAMASDASDLSDVSDTPRKAQP